MDPSIVLTLRRNLVRPTARRVKDDMTILPTCNLQISADPSSGSLRVEWDKQKHCPAVPNHLTARSAVLESLKAATEGSATMPFPLGCFEVYSQFVDGSGPVDWLINSMKVLFPSG